jgi:chromosome segregation ATPase
MEPDKKNSSFDSSETSMNGGNGIALPPVPVGDGSCNAAMNLFEKYSNLNRGIDEVRKEMKQVRVEIDEIQGKIKRMRQDRESMKRDIIDAKQETGELHQQIDQANEKLLELEGQRSRALMRKQRAERELQQFKDYRDNQFHQFKERSREFRAAIKRERFRAAESGLKNAQLQAFATVMTDPSVMELYPKMVVPVSPRDFEERTGTIFFPAKQRGGQVPFADDGIQTTLTTDPRLWIPDPRDQEMKNALEEYRKEIAEYEKRQKEVEELRTMHRDASEKSKSRAERKEQLQAQFNRIEKDNAAMEHQTESLKEETEEVRAMGKSFEKRECYFLQLRSECKPESHRTNPSLLA